MGDTTGLQGAWLLNETSGTRVDETANNNDLTDNNTVTSRTGQFGNAAEFVTANSEYLSIADASQTGLDFAGDFTIGAWAYFDAASGNQVVIAKHNNTGNQRSYQIYVEFVASQGKIHFAISDDGTNTGNFLDFTGSTTTLAAATWYHIAGRLSGTTQEIFLNAVSDGSTTRVGTAFNATSAFVLGATNDGGGAFIGGAIDEAFAFSRALSTAEISDIKDNGLSEFITPTAAANSMMLLGVT